MSDLARDSIERAALLEMLQQAADLIHKFGPQPFGPVASVMTDTGQEIDQGTFDNLGVQNELIGWALDASEKGLVTF